jgi:hypothetical protein
MSEEYFLLILFKLDKRFFERVLRSSFVSMKICVVGNSGSTVKRWLLVSTF